MTDFWTDERLALLREKRAEGYSALRIALILGEGCTRDAVLGKAHRMGFEAPPRPPPRKAELRSRRVSAVVLRPPPEIPEPAGALEVPADGVPLYDLRRSQCRWLLAPGPPWRFCGQRQERGSYCAEHAVRVYASRAEQEEDA